MKDVTKMLSERATRFLPVDMKDRLKSAFNRTSSASAPNPAPSADDVPDYTAIFNTNKAAPEQKNSRIEGQVEPTQIVVSPPTATRKSADQQAGAEIQDIEEAEIVWEPSGGAEWKEAPIARIAAGVDATVADESSNALAELQAPTPTQIQTQIRTKVAEVAGDAPDYSAVFKINRSQRRDAEIRSAPPRFDASSFKTPVGYKSEPRQVELDSQESKFEEINPVFKVDESKPDRIDDTLEATSGNFNGEEPMSNNHRSRFGFGDTESVRLKVEKRNEERRPEEPQPVIASNGVANAPEPTPPEPKSAETNARNTEEHMAAGFAYEAKPLEQPRDIHRAQTETVVTRSAPPETNIIYQKENSSMEAKGHESDNGLAAGKTEASSGAAISIERNSKFSGQLKFSGAIAIDGQVEGELVAERVVVHEGGIVNATVEGNTVVIAGTVKGDIYARTELEILPSGVVHGSVTAPAINVRRGGRVEGRCAIGVPRQ